MIHIDTGLKSLLRSTLDARTEPEGVHHLADLYWHMLLGAMFIACIALFLFGTWNLADVQGNRVTPAIEHAGFTPPFNRAELDSTLQTYRDRANAFADLKATPLDVPADPSR